MLFFALLSAAAGADPALVARADESNERYVQCLFSVSRDAQGKAISESEFSSLLAGSCETERAQLHEAFVAVRMQRGSTPAQSEAEWTSLEAQGRASVERAYRIGRAVSQ